MTGQTSILGYFLHAGWVVKAVMMLLLAASIVTWTLIFQRVVYFKQKKLQYTHFNRRFWGSTDLSLLYADIDHKIEERQGLAAIFHAGFKEFLRLRHTKTFAMPPIQRVMDIHHAKEAQQLEAHLAWFASVGSIAPYIGLFGTVWGIMTSFQALGQAQQATIAMVAPGISEALVATALGLFTAIPAVIAYNRFSVHANQVLDHYALFQEEFLALVDAQIDSRSGAA